jgi:hypothetical protein
MRHRASSLIKFLKERKKGKNEERGKTTKNKFGRILEVHLKSQRLCGFCGTQCFGTFSYNDLKVLGHTTYPADKGSEVSVSLA